MPNNILGSHSPPYAAYKPGTPEWIAVWKQYPEFQTEMLTYQKLLQSGINPIENTGTTDDVFRVSNSALEASATCSTLALLRYGYQVIPIEDVFPIQVGTAIHAALAVLYRTGDKQAAFIALLNTYPKGLPPKANYEWDNVSCIMTHYIDAVVLPYFISPDLVELWFEQVLHEDEEGTIVLCGRIDALPQDNTTQSLWVMDNKSTGKITDWWLKKFRMGSQLTGYTWAASRFLGQHIPGAIINGIELPKLPMPGKKCRVHGVDYAECRKYHANHQVFQLERPPHALETWKLDAVYQAKRLRELVKTYAVSPEGIKYVRMQGTMCGGCTFCSFIDFCIANRPVEWIGSVLQYKPELVKVEG